VTRSLRRPAAVGVIVALVFVAGWWKVLWEPQGAALSKAHKQTATASSNLYTVEQNIGHLKHLQAISPKLAALEKQLSAAVPATDEVDQFLLSFNALVQQAGVTVGSLAFSQPAAAGTSVSTIGLHFGVDGDYFAVQGFLDSMRASSRIIVIDALSEAPSSKGSKGGGGVSLTLSAHLLTGLTAPAPAAQKLLSPPTTAAPTGIISGPVTKARNAVSGANANSAQTEKQANAAGGD